jgi:hypothetical protein
MVDIQPEEGRGYGDESDENSADDHTNTGFSFQFPEPASTPWV